MKVNCLLRNTQAVSTVSDIVKVLVAKRLTDKKTANIESIYADLRDNGIEIDVESLGVIYDGLYGKYNEKYLSNTAEVEEYAGMEFKKQMDSLVDDILGESKQSEEQIGKLSPEKEVANNISKLFQKSLNGVSEKTKSAMKTLQDMVMKAAQAQLKAGEKKQMDIISSLTKFFSAEGIEFHRLDGTINTMETLFENVKQQVKNYINEVEQTGKLDSEQLSELKSQWDQYTDAFINSAYDIVLNKAEQNSLLNNSLKGVQVDGVNILNVNGGINWDRLIEFGNVDSIVDAVKKMYRTGVKDNDGNTVTFTPTQAERIGEYFRRVYEQRINDATQRAVNNSRVKNLSPKNIISSFIKDRGFFNLIKNADGKLLLSQTDWDGFINTIKKGIPARFQKADISNLDQVKNVFQNYLSNIKDSDGNPKFSDYQKRIITEEFVDSIIGKLQPQTNDVTDLDRLVALSNINNGVAFNEETQAALNKLVGVNNLSQKSIDRINKLAALVQKILYNSTGYVTTASGQTISRAAYSFKYIAEIDREIKRIIRADVEQRSGLNRAVNWVSDSMGSATMSLLLNPRNVTENPITQIGTSVAQSANILFKSPVLFLKTWSSTQKAYWTTFWDNLMQGANPDIYNELELSDELHSGELYTAREAYRQVKENGLSGVFSVAKRAHIYMYNIALRSIMNSFDAATTSSLMRKQMILSTYDALQERGYSNSQILNEFDKVLKIDATTKQEIKAENERLFNELKNEGIIISSATKAANLNDMYLSFYEDIISGITDNKDVSAKTAREATTTLIKAAQSVSKKLGGKQRLSSNDFISLGVYRLADVALAPQKIAFEKSKAAEEMGRLGKSARWKLSASIWQNTVAKFVGGVANFLNLGISATPFGAIQLYSLKTQLQEHKEKNIGVADIFTANAEQYRRYSELNGQIRAIAARSIMGSMAIMGIVAKATFDDDDEDSLFSNLLETKSGQGLITKLMPMGVALVSPFLYSDDDKGKKTWEIFKNMVGRYTGQGVGKQAEYLTRDLSKARDANDYGMALAGFFNSYIPTFNINQGEQITRFIHDVGSAFDTSKISEVEWDERVSKDIYRDAETIMDKILINGAIDAIRRSLSSDEVYNRFKSSSNNAVEF